MKTRLQAGEQSQSFSRSRPLLPREVLSMGASCRRTNDGTSRMTPPHHTACLPVVDRTVMICAVDRRVPAARTKVIEWLRGLGLGKIVAVGIRRWTGSVPSPDVGQERFEDHRHDGRPPPVSYTHLTLPTILLV